MSAVSLFEKRAAKKHKFFTFLNGCYFVMGNPGQIRDVCSLENIGESRFHATNFKCT